MVANHSDQAGILLVDKPQGITSFDVIRHLRREGGVAKAGHAGTLDPMATGLMIVLIGAATKQADRFLKLDKCYRATIQLGANSSTGDAEGELTPVSDRVPSPAELDQAISHHTGLITQTPPAYSAIKIKGVAAYKRARRGEKVEIPSRQVTIHDLQILDFSYPNLAVSANVSSGTYIRTLAEDIGRQLGTGAYLTALRRLSIGDYTVEQAIKLDDVNPAAVSSHLMKPSP